MLALALRPAESGLPFPTSCLLSCSSNHPSFPSSHSGLLAIPSTVSACCLRAFAPALLPLPRQPEVLSLRHFRLYWNVNFLLRPSVATIPTLSLPILATQYTTGVAHLSCLLPVFFSSEYKCRKTEVFFCCSLLYLNFETNACSELLLWDYRSEWGSKWMSEFQRKMKVCPKH